MILFAVPLITAFLAFIVYGIYYLCKKRYEYIAWKKQKDKPAESEDDTKVYKNKHESIGQQSAHKDETELANKNADVGFKETSVKESPIYSNETDIILDIPLTDFDPSSNKSLQMVFNEAKQGLKV